MEDDLGKIKAERDALREQLEEATSDKIKAG